MKNILIILFLLPFLSDAQNISAFGYNKVRIVESDKSTLAEIIPVTTHHKLKTNRMYYWYSSNTINSTQGGFSGKLLNGLYDEYYLDKNLKEQGAFNGGLKDGPWKSWKEDGTLIGIIYWKKGVIVPENTIPFWKKLNIFKGNKQPADSGKRPAK